MKTIRVTHALLTGLVLSIVVATGAASASEPQLEKAVAAGKNLFSHNPFGGNGRVCESCHLYGGTEPGKLPNGNIIPGLGNAAAIFPRFNAKNNRIVTLQDQVRNCVANALQGNPPAYGSEEMNDLVSYLTSLSQGKPIDMGGKPQ